MNVSMLLEVEEEIVFRHVNHVNGDGGNDGDVGGPMFTFRMAVNLIRSLPSSDAMFFLSREKPVPVVISRKVFEEIIIFVSSSTFFTITNNFSHDSFLCKQSAHSHIVFIPLFFLLPL